MCGCLRPKLTARDRQGEKSVRVHIIKEQRFMSICSQSYRTALHIACKRHVPSLTDELVRCKSCVPYKVDKVRSLFIIWLTT